MSTHDCGTSSTAIHTQVEGSLAWVDEGLAVLLELMWESGLQTQYSCQGGPEKLRHSIDSTAQIVFANVEDGVDFLRETMRIMDWQHQWSEMFTLRVVNPLPQGNDLETRFWYEGAQPRSEVTWHHLLTPTIADGWMFSRSQRDDWVRLERLEREMSR